MPVTGILGACLSATGVDGGVLAPRGRRGGTKSKGGLFSGVGSGVAPYPTGGWWRAWGERQGLSWLSRSKSSLSKLSFAIKRVGLRGVA